MVFLLFMGTVVVGGMIWGRRREKSLGAWYEKLRKGISAADVPEMVRQDCFNTLIRATMLTVFVWLLASIFFGGIAWARIGAWFDSGENIRTLTWDSGTSLRHSAY